MMALILAVMMFCVFAGLVTTYTECTACCQNPQFDCESSCICTFDTGASSGMFSPPVTSGLIPLTNITYYATATGFGSCTSFNAAVQICMNQNAGGSNVQGWLSSDNRILLKVTTTTWTLKYTPNPISPSNSYTYTCSTTDFNGCGSAVFAFSSSSGSDTCGSHPATVVVDAPSQDNCLCPCPCLATPAAGRAQSITLDLNGTNWPSAAAAAAGVPQATSYTLNIGGNAIGLFAITDPNNTNVTGTIYTYDTSGCVLWSYYASSGATYTVKVALLCSQDGTLNLFMQARYLIAANPIFETAIISTTPAYSPIIPVSCSSGAETPIALPTFYNVQTVSPTTTTILGTYSGTEITWP